MGVKFRRDFPKEKNVFNISIFDEMIDFLKNFYRENLRFLHEEFDTG